jgi:hypothetical protein
MQNKIMEIVISGIILIALDGTFIGTHLNTYKKVVKDIQGSELSIKGVEALVICYVCLIGGLYYFILKEKRSVLDAFWFGVVIYGVYATTVYSMFKGYPAYLAGMDVLWGGILMATTTWATRSLMKYMA